jgi:membrane associated rhomboid family serine protease
MELTEKKRLKYSLLFPSFFIFTIWMVKISEVALDLDFSYLGIYPHQIKGLIGIITSPLIHQGFAHLFDNSVPLFFLSVAIFYFYRGISYRIFFIIYIVTGLLVWISGRSAYHIGASGLVYGYASFLFFSGIIRNNINLLAISLLIAFLYGSLIWGIFPFKSEISWESHLMGTVTGLAMAWIYRKEGPQTPKPDFGEEEENDVDWKILQEDFGEFINQDKERL